MSTGRTKRAAIPARPPRARPISRPLPTMQSPNAPRRAPGKAAFSTQPFAPTARRRPACWKTGRSGGLERRRRNAELEALCRRIAFAVRPDLVAHAHARNEVGVTGLLDRGDVHEKVPAPIVRNDEAIPLLRVEPLYLAGGHREFSWEGS